ncbi:SPOR domain-containing protein [Paracoccus hibiscisoli]|uniref:SPOR domain-containing protein n=1 Tax=Paracoccus hibiscisoli TaxID=2023261 RepID=A0A4U0QKJ9_9RHOB|nr:SPOR domain-containing protein [Paracoccus hibiscisoli]TJZ82267.1 SPOR domain-containing protein [Paracoccus hibiscisoli]
MIGQWRVLAMLLLGGAAQAAPVPPPPDGFSGAQYIDGQGCVFTRDGGGWAPRMDGTGQALCGFPPSMDVRRTDPAADRALPLTPPPAPDIETVLMEELSRNLGAGEWNADPRPVDARAEPAPSRRTDPIQTALQDALAAAPAVRDAAGLSGSAELCARLGYRPDPDGTAQGSTLGLCPGMRAEPAIATLTTGVRLPVAPAVQPRPSPAVPAKPATARATPPAASATVTRDRRTAPAATPSPAPAPVPAKAPDVEMIPASARYVQVGAYADDENAMIVLRALAARGYPTGQGRAAGEKGPLRLVMAGPFADRQALIAALNDLRRNGYPRAVAR